MTPIRETLTFRRALSAPADRVYTALTDPMARKVWGLPGDGFEYRLATTAPPQEGAREIGHIFGGEEGETEIITDWILLHPGERVTYAETLAHGGLVLGLSFAEADLAQSNTGCELTLVVHVTAYVGPEIIAEMQAGWEHAVETLALYVTENQAD